MGQQFFVENRPGAGGSLATEFVTRTVPDGYTLLLSGSNDACAAPLGASHKMADGSVLS
jgi:tripartite-type tricarboxylate transporter receptor subunit TctC